MKQVIAIAMEHTKATGAAELLSTRGFRLQADRSWIAVVDIISDVYDEQTNPNGYVSLGIAENRLMHKEMIHHINSYFDLPERLLTYADGGVGTKELRNACAKFLTKHLKSRIAVSPEEVLCFPGVTPTIEEISSMIADPGEGILLGRPYYNSFLIDMGLRARVKAVTVSFGDIDQFSLKAVEKYEETLLLSEKAGVKIRGLILCSPHNPLGRCYPIDVLVAFLKLCQKHQIHLISDEIYALSVWKNKDKPNAIGFTSILELDFEKIIDPNLLHVLWGVSKDFGANGLRLGCAVIRNEPLRVSLIAHSNFTFISSTTDKIVTDLLSNSEFVEGYIKENQIRLSQAYSHITDFLKSKDIPYYQECNSAFFVWAELRPVYLRKRNRSTDLTAVEGMKVDDEIYGKLLDNRLAIGKGRDYGDEAGGWFRIVFSHPKEYINLGMQKLWQVIDGDG